MKVPLSLTGSIQGDKKPFFLRVSLQNQTSVLHHLQRITPPLKDYILLPVQLSFALVCCSFLCNLLFFTRLAIYFSVPHTRIEGFSRRDIRTPYALRPRAPCWIFWNNEICFNFVSILFEKIKLTVSERTYIIVPMV